MAGDLSRNSHADAEFGHAFGGLGVERAKYLVGNAVAARRFGFDDEYVWPGGQSLFGTFELHAGIDSQSFTALFGDQSDPLIFDQDDGFERLVELIAIAVAIAVADKVHAAIIECSERGIDRQPPLGRHRALFVQLDFQKAEISIDIVADTRFAAFAAALVMVIIAAPLGIVEIARGVAESALPLDFQHIENVGHCAERGPQTLCGHDIFIVDPLQHSGLGIERIKADRAISGKATGNGRIHGKHSFDAGGGSSGLAEKDVDARHIVDVVERIDVVGHDLHSKP